MEFEAVGRVKQRHEEKKTFTLYIIFTNDNNYKYSY